MAEAFSTPTDATLALEAIFGPLSCDGLIGYDFADLGWLWKGDEPQRIWHQRLEGDDLASLLLELSEFFKADAAQRVLCNIGHPTLAVSLVQYEQVMAIVAAHFNAPVRGTIWRRTGPGYVIDVVVSAVA